MKRISLFVLALLLIVLSACGSGNDKGDNEGEATNDDGGNGGTIALLMADLGNPFFHVLSDAVEEQGKELGYEVLVYDGQNDASKQPSQVEDALQQGVDAIIINPADESSTANALKDAIAQDIPVVTVDREVDIEGILSYLVTDNTKGGELVGKWLEEKMPEGGKVIHMEGIIGTAPQRERGGGFLSVIDPAQNSDSKFTILDTAVGEFSMAPAEAAMSDMLSKHDDIDVVFAQNDTMAVGVVRAIETAGREDDGILVLGFDGAKEAYDLIDEGKMAATAVQDFEFIGAEAVNYVDTYLKDGTKPEEEVLVDVFMSDEK
ncbi:sugar ABC transporter substrate-binding protein [Pseudogracilibacillus auburnensis]|uniref:Monosaccharide ABC transporter substrate-binding protein (CUT2 family) n=1 Tax=Pseudogracilibacillus auburnensis TaxID=1494959 RepID=A0A2V3WAS3_9BACI|nr:sugar ABC transporter substrate-binding protein [Pseudogracilibacillus auburnensis]PXW90244.1 monosaccharide ABC transporter substrate-binding protein (CUT2 family) [Pseudogracilibacillus auburnensis]